MATHAAKQVMSGSRRPPAFVRDPVDFLPARGVLTPGGMGGA
jgi:hypothetical protein